MSEILELPELPQDNRVAQVKIRPAGVATELDIERSLGFDGLLDFPCKISFGYNLGDASPDDIHLFVERREQSSLTPYSLSDGPFRVTLRNVFPLVEFPLAAGKANQNLDDVMGKVRFERHER